MDDIFDLKNKTALVTGGSRGLGLQIAEALAEKGARVIILGKSQDNLINAQNLLKDKNLIVETICQDLIDNNSIENIFNELTFNLKINRLDILVNNAGVSYNDHSTEHPTEIWDWVNAINVRSVFLLCQLVAKKWMIPQNYGRIINISSIAAQGSNQYIPMLAYSCSKGSLNTLTKVLAVEWGKFGITVNAIAPGFFPTEQSQGGVGIFDQETLLNDIPLRRLGDNEDLKGAIYLFGSKAGKHITGQILNVDGGLTARL